MQKKKNVKSVRPAAKKTAARKIVPKAAKKVARKSAATPVKKTVRKSAKISHRDKKLLEIKKKLLTQKKTLLIGAIEALNELPGQTAFPDLGDQATAEIDRNFMLRLKGRERKLLKKIDEAIDRIEHGVFGICDKCGCEIDVRRLEARPVTTMCIECKTLQEEEEKLREA
jgi:DnaK suppressor protein